MQLNVCKGVFVNTDNVDFICAATGSRPLVRMIEGYKKEDELFNLCGGKAIKSYVFLKSGRVLCSDVNPDTLRARMEKTEKGGPL